MDTLSVSKNLEKVPETLRRELCEFLMEDSIYQGLEQILQDTGLVLEKDKFQITIHSAEVLRAIREYLSDEKNVCV